MEILGLLLMGVGGIAVAIGGIWFLVVAFQESVLWGIGCLIIPLVSLIFLIMHFDKAWRPFALQIAGLVPLYLGLFLSVPPGEFNVEEIGRIDRHAVSIVLQ